VTVGLGDEEGEEVEETVGVDVEVDVAEIEEDSEAPDERLGVTEK
jgi:hypothetical protein